MPKLTIDGQEIEVAKGENLIQAARHIGREIPHFCYHEKLTIAANCRMCLVEIEKNPKLQPACQQLASDGMVVHTQSPKAVEARAAVMEFLLVNHPLDCPICDKAGECKLQDYYMEDDGRNSRQSESKTQKPRLEVLGPLVNYNAERCIMCTRCVRFMQEIPKNPQLGVFGRGDRNIIGVFEGEPLDDPYSLNVVELCPVGALGNLDFRFHSRVWQLGKTNTVCGGCAKGCNTEVHHKNGILYRMVPRQNDEVNSTWMCDEGRLSYHANNDNRALEAYVGGQPTTSADALAKATAFWAAAKAKSGADLVVYVSPMLTSEEAYAWLGAIKANAPKATLYLSGRPDGVGDDLLRRADKNGNRRGVNAVASALGLKLAPFNAKPTQGSALVLGTELPAALALPSNALVLGSHLTSEFLKAAVGLPLATHFEQSGSFVNEDGRVQRLRPTHEPLKHSHTGWGWLTLLGDAAVEDANSVFIDLASKLKDFAGMTLLGLGQLGKVPSVSVEANQTGGAQA